MHSIAPEIITKIGFFPITNTFINIIIVDIFLLIAVFLISRKLILMPKRLQTGAELVIGGLYEFTSSLSPKHKDKIFPFFITFFIFILFVNWSGLIPGFTTIGPKHGNEITPLIRSATSDLNVTLALALVSIIATHALSINVLGIREYLGRFFSLNPIILFVGILELFSEFTKVVSLSFRLFGNILAGEIVLGTVSNIFAFIFPLPFLLLEFIVGIVQALVFSMLTLVFMVILTTSHKTHEAKEVIS